ncbi:MAG: redoxin domain-containing protein [Spirochaetota bacterium]
MRIASLLCFSLLIHVCAERTIVKEKPSQTISEISGSQGATPFPKNAEWFNTEKPLKLKSLLGKIIILDFWTYSCIHCHHVIPELKRLQSEWPNELLVIGVHSPKYNHEKNSKSLQKALQRHAITYPVIHDKDFKLWQAYGLNYWPSFVIIDPEGKIIGKHTGEGIYHLFSELIESVHKTFSQKNLFNPSPVTETAKKKDAIFSTTLSFPSKLAIDAKEKTLYIADTNHHRILAVSIEEKKITKVIGSGQPGKKDGVFQKAMFHSPHGIFLHENLLYIADTGNHSIREANFHNDYVKTVAGTGEQAQIFNVEGKAHEVALNSPWDLLRDKEKLYIAMAGTHQIWEVNLKNDSISVLAGSGRENLFDGKHRQAALAQPSGLSKGENVLYVADSEVSAVRAIDLVANGEIRTIVGKGLFDFGDTDGTYPSPRLQHPLAVLEHHGKLYLADTYNHKIKTIDPQKRECHTFAGSGKIGNKDGSAQESSFHEPSGLAILENTMYVADRNNHLVRSIDLATGEVSTFHFQSKDDSIHPLENEHSAKFSLAQISISPRSESISLSIVLGKKYQWNSNEEFFQPQFSTANTSLKILPDQGQQKQYPYHFTLKLPLQDGEFQISSRISFCESKNPSLCFYKNIEISGELNVEEKGMQNPHIELKYHPFSEQKSSSKVKPL